MEIHWFELKKLDKSTNHSSRTEIIKEIKKKGHLIYYYCTYNKKKMYFGLNNNINYLGFSRNIKYMRYLSFYFLVTLRASYLAITRKNIIIMVNPELIHFILLSKLISKILKKNNKFVVDVRTIPVSLPTFKKDMIAFHRKFRLAVWFFDGFSFISPFMRDYILSKYTGNYLSVVWGSGVNKALFNPAKYKNDSNKNVLKIFYHGGISISRGNLDLIKACQSLRNLGYLICLLQVGILVNKEIKDYIQFNNLQDWCKIYDPLPIEKIPELISRSDLPVLPFPNFMGWRVSSPIKLMEYLIMGKKVLAPDIECFTNLLPKESNLIYYYKSSLDNNSDNIADELLKIIKKKKINNFNQHCRDFALSNLTWDIQANKLIQFFEKL